MTNVREVRCGIISRAHRRRAALAPVAAADHRVAAPRSNRQLERGPHRRDRAVLVAYIQSRATAPERRARDTQPEGRRRPALRNFGTVQDVPPLVQRHLAVRRIQFRRVISSQGCDRHVEVLRRHPIRPAQPRIAFEFCARLRPLIFQLVGDRVREQEQPEVVVGRLALLQGGSVC